jgi:hypothetical protein
MRVEGRQKNLARFHCSMNQGVVAGRRTKRPVSQGSSCVVSQSSEQFNANSESFQTSSQNRTCGSEANSVIANFNALGNSQKQDILNFLRSL